MEPCLVQNDIEVAFATYFNGNTKEKQTYQPLRKMLCCSTQQVSTLSRKEEILQIGEASSEKKWVSVAFLAVKRACAPLSYEPMLTRIA